MNKRTIISLAIIILAFAAIGGATMAWFTASVPLTNTFTAGTLTINATDGWAVKNDQGVWDNVNPGDCNIKKFNITNTGSKHALIRFKYSGQWLGSFPVGFSPDNSLVTPTTPANWVYSNQDGYYYYTLGPLKPTGALNGEDKAIFDLKICVAGAAMGNEYQGKSYKIDFTVEAIQASNNASGNLWGVDSWYLKNGVAVEPLTPELDRSAANWGKYDPSKITP